MVKSNLSTEDRKKRLQEIKAKSKCLNCGQVGHWSGDPQCPKGRGGQATNKTPPKQASILGHVFGGWLFVDFANPHAMMAYKHSPSKLTQGGTMRDEVPPGGDTKFSFCQHRGLTFEEVTWRFPGCASWGFREKAPSLYLSQYLDWVHNYYTIDQKTMEVSRREVPLDQMGVPGMEASASDQAIPARSAHKSAKKKPPNPPLLSVRCRKCTDFSFLGTNAYVQVKTCKDCGKVEKMKKEMPEKKDIHSCEHKNTNRLGSNKATMRVFCKDCGNFIDEMPREEAKRRQATGREVETMSAACFDLESSIQQSVNQGVELTTEQAVVLLDQFRTQVEDHMVAQDVAGEASPPFQQKSFTAYSKTASKHPKWLESLTHFVDRQVRRIGLDRLQSASRQRTGYAPRRSGFMATVDPDLSRTMRLD